VKRETPITPAAALRERLAELHAGERITIVTDAESYRDRVLVAVRIPSAEFVMTINRAEYDGLAILKILGVPDAPPEAHRPDAMTRALAQKKRTTAA
jgi:hypothetical protein